MNDFIERLKNGIIYENTTFVQVIAMCPTLAVSTSVNNAIGMGIAATAVLIGSNAVISMLRKFIPDRIRIPAFIVVIASFVTIIEFLMKGFTPDLYKSLGIFIPLIVVNCVILGRAEAYASQNGVLKSIYDAIGMGAGFTLALSLLAVVRELIGAGQLFGLQVMPKAYQPALIMIMAPGGFMTLGIFMAVVNYYRLKKDNKPVELGCENCSGCSSNN